MMEPQLIDWMAAVWQVLKWSHGIIIWNLFLAFIPLVLSVWLFRYSRTRSLVWWMGFLAFIAFLPNAPYVLTDIIHLIDLTRWVNSVWLITLVLIPQYLIYILAGFEAYVISLINLGYYLQTLGKEKYIPWVELIPNALCSIGIYLGRFNRFNSWDIVAQPKQVARSVIENFT